jgi:hypothetical protein
MEARCGDVHMYASTQEVETRESRVQGQLSPRLETLSQKTNSEVCSLVVA